MLLMRLKLNGNDSQNIRNITKGKKKSGRREVPGVVKKTRKT